VHPVDVAFAVGLLALLLAYGAEKRRSGLWSEMLFGCHVATAVLAIGLLARAPSWIGAALVFHLGVGIPSWIVYAAARKTTRPLEVLAHVLPSIAALPAMIRSGIPSGVALVAWVGFLVLQLISYWTTPPALNVNLAHGPSPELARFVRRPWPARALLAATALVMMLVVEEGLARLLGRLPPGLPAGSPSASLRSVSP
jgi:hypothetical protein